MSGFKFSTAFIGPFAVSVGTGRAGDTQKLRYKIPPSKELIGQGTFVLSGSLHANWSSGFSKDQVFEVGGNLSTDRVFEKKVLILNEDLTLTALTDCSYICTSAVGIKQKVHMDRQALEPGQALVVPRYELLVIGGDAAVRINGKAPSAGPRLVYARSQELHIEAQSAAVVATLSFKA
ncbi:MAG: hypothetical protein QM749_14020 [Aquabacterium sp.]